MEGIEQKPSHSDEAIIKKLNLKKYAAHIFLCTGPKCCNPDQGEKLWACLKEQTAELYAKTGLTIQRTRAQCLRVCKDGPIAVVYPAGMWLKDVRIEQIPLLLESIGRNKIPTDLSIIANREIE